MTELWLLRHGQTDWNLTGRWQGQASEAPGLNETGRKQAMAASEKMRRVAISAIYCSDLLRARQTAEILAIPFGLPVFLEQRLREINLGMWEGMPFEMIETQYPNELAARRLDPYHTSAPNGESPDDVAKRVLEAMNMIANKHPGQSILIVGHGITLSIINCLAQGFPMEDVYKHIPENANPHRVQWPERK